MCHESESCVAIAERTLTEAIADSQAAHSRTVEAPIASAKRAAQLAHRFSDERCRHLRVCVEGRCSCRSDEPRVFCSKGCGRGVHVVGCLRMSSARGALHVFTCGDCRAAEMVASSCSPLPSLVAEGDRNALLELSTGAEGTARGHAEFARMERLWLAHVASSSPGVAISNFILPRHSEESFVSWMRWLVTDSSRARSFHTIFRSAAGALEQIGGTNWTKSPRVKVVLKELGQSNGVQVVPDSHATRRILSIMFEQTLAKVSPSLRARTYVMATLETMGGVRVGEACGGGDGHGALANNLCIMRPAGTQVGHEGESVELWLEDSKTSYPRYVNFVGKSRGIGIEGADHIRRLWAECGFSEQNGMLTQAIEDGLIVERPDYFVVRVSFVDMNDSSLAKLQRAITRAIDGEIALHSKASLAKLKGRSEAHTIGEERRYVNVAGGARGSRRIEAAVRYLEGCGLGKYVDVVPGPLLRATHGKLLTHMPIAVESSYTHLIGALKGAWRISEGMDEPDLELDLEGLDKPKWAHHSLRRTATKIARDSMATTGVDAEDIDEMLGWDQAEREKNSQRRYAGRRERSRRARVTMMI